MSRILRLCWIVCLLVVTFTAGQMGLFAPSERSLREVRFATADRQPSGDIVFVEIDASSLQAFGVWPWPRQIHADLLDRLMAMNVNQVFFDVDFSAASSPRQDAALESALERAGGYATLAAFQQLSGADATMTYNRPLERFSQHAPYVLVNISTDAAGLVVAAPNILELGEENVPSLALALSPQAPVTRPETVIDYGINANAIPRIPVSAILNGTADPALLEGKDVVVGASAIELRDFYNVPRFGMMPGPLIQIMAAETRLAGRSMQDWGIIPSAVAAALLGLLTLLGARRFSISQLFATALSLALLWEVIAALTQRFAPVMFDTLPFHLALAALMIISILDERATRRRQHDRAQRQRAMTQQVMSQIVTDNFDGILVVDDSGTIIAASKAAAQILHTEDPEGREAATVLPAPILGRLNSGEVGGPFECECEIDWKSHILELVITRSQVPDLDRSGQFRQISCLTFQDVTERRRQEQRLAYLARHDAVTGALSRQAFVEEADLLLGRSNPMTMFLVQLHRLREVNTALGHEVSDRVLRQVHKRLRGRLAVRPSRLGTDLFAFIIAGVADAEEARRHAGELAKLIDAPYIFDGHSIFLEANFGISTTATGANGAGELLREAEIALAAGVGPGERVVIFEASHGERIKARQDLDIALREALQRKEFFLVFQPQVDLASRELVGAEALVRWKSATLGVVSPADFIPLAEETGLIVELGDWVMKAACMEAAQWPGQQRLAVNVSALQFRFGDVLGTVRDAIRQSGLAPSRLDIEITESLFVGNETCVVATLDELRAMGIGVAIDDFGTGYSSLSYLGRLPVDKIKVDQSFVRGLPDPQSRAIIDTIVAMAQRLGMSVVAEGIETAEQLDYLASIHCQVGQGYYFGRPQSAASHGLAAPGAA